MKAIGKYIVIETIKEKNIKRLDSSNLSSGFYNLSIMYNHKRYNKQIIKQ